ncbi:MAG TPA: hypothetical protein VH328_15105, partial [Burkholderiaceae bacterium]|nr:hypothetical protein [Burkholderiaceae bacterium]
MAKKTPASTTPKTPAKAAKPAARAAAKSGSKADLKIGARDMPPNPPTAPSKELHVFANPSSGRDYVIQFQIP